ncbi:RNA polymerase sigma factor [Roseimicrobium sp. ORNL1]|uniref:RNA polymerase sigma factor n=1 Tax=Roseimicrobium sp. ORNL1 TaxID=2711231 RepID=UPI0013E1C341|nr:RNA polymerase sigma factor [Roseimicrobium sp. ORNL1]QIF03828.1 RNA polymerase sigma factor [Roseimicrobium sp. ORNL1]
MTPYSLSPFIEDVLPDYERVQQYFSSKVGCEHTARDLTQETFAKLLRWSPASAVDHPRRVLFRTARNLLIDRFRRVRRMSEEELSDDLIETLADRDPGPSRRAAAAEEIGLVSRAVEILPEQIREVFILNRLMGLSFAEIAKTMKLSSSTVERHMVRALLACRAALEGGNSQKI